MNYFFLITGLTFLVKGADYLIEGSTSLAKRLGVPSLIIGLTVVAIGTSLPEFIINIFSAINASTELAFGNVIGSNIANTLLILGVVALIRPLKIAHSTVWREIPFSLLAAVTLALLVSLPITRSNDSMAFLTRADGFILFAFFGLFIFYLFRLAAKSRSDLVDRHMEIEVFSNMKTLTLIILGITGLYLGGNWTVNSAVSIARGFGASEFLISATIVAFGTSLPELITSTRAAFRNDSDLAIGNVVGSNVLNISWVLATTTMIAPVAIPQGINVDLVFLLVSAMLLFIFLFVGQKHILEKWQGVLFLLGYVSYIVVSVLR